MIWPRLITSKRVDLIPSSSLWFPKVVSDLDMVMDSMKLPNVEDAFGCEDTSYRQRRNHIAAKAKSYRHGGPIPHIEYTNMELNTWKVVYERAHACHQKWACKEYLNVMTVMEESCGYSMKEIPQLESLSASLQKLTGWTIRPACGLLSARFFLNALAFKVFPCTQYIRNASNPFFSTEPDICHELIGHVPLLADAAFAELSHQIGLASLMASDEEVQKLALLYWWTVEVGVLMEGEHVKAYGASLLSSCGELEWACKTTPFQACTKFGNVAHLQQPSFFSLDSDLAARTEMNDQMYSPHYFLSESQAHTSLTIKEFCSKLVASQRLRNSGQN